MIASAPRLAIIVLLCCCLSIVLTANAFAFATVRPSNRAVINKRLQVQAGIFRINANNANSATSPSFQLYDQSPSQSTFTISKKSSMIHKTTTAIGKTASTLVSVSFFLLLAYQRDSIILTLWIGSILNAILSKVAKKVLNHERPAELQSSDRIKLKPSDGGMPSSHAMSLGFIGTSILGGVVPIEHRVMVGLAMVAYTAMALRYRVRDHLHTLDQVVVGLVLGVGNALLWLKFGVGVSGSESGPVLAWVRDNCVSAETGLFPYSALAVPVVVGILVVGSFERRIALWTKNRSKEQ